MVSLTQTTYSIDSSESMITVIHLQRGTGGGAGAGLDSKRPSNASLNCSFASGSNNGTSCGPNGLSIGSPNGPGFANSVACQQQQQQANQSSANTTNAGLVSPRSPLSPVSLRSQRRYSPSLMVPGDYSTALFGYQSRIDNNGIDSSPPGTGGSTTPRRASSEILTEETDISLSLNPTQSTVINANDNRQASGQKWLQNSENESSNNNNNLDENDMIQIHSPSSSSEPTLSEKCAQFDKFKQQHQQDDNFDLNQSSLTTKFHSKDSINTKELSYSPPEIRTPDSTANDICMMSANLCDDRPNHHHHQTATGIAQQNNHFEDIYANANKHTTFQFSSNETTTTTNNDNNTQNNNINDLDGDHDEQLSDEAKFEKFCQYRTIHKVINDFCVRHTREELEFLIGRVGNLKIIDCYFSERHKTLCMIVEVLD